MTLLALGGLLLLLCFGLVILVGAPYVPTLTPQIRAAFELLDLQPNDTVLELGCGDGKVLVWAAEHGYRAVGIEINPVLAAIAWARTRRYRGRVRVVWGNYWTMQWPTAEAVYVFLGDAFMKRLDRRMNSYGGKLASVAFRVPHKRSVAERDGVFVYDYR